MFSYRLFFLHAPYCSDTKGSNDPEVAIVLNRLGSGYSGLKMYQKAQPLLERALTILQSLASPSVEHQRALASVLESAGILYRDQGLAAKALPYFENALEIRFVVRKIQCVGA